MRFKGAIFDQDGLLFDTEILFARAWKAAGREMGLEVPDDLPRSCCGCGTNVLPDVIRRFFPSIDIEAYMKRALRLAFDAQLTSSPVPKPGAVEILKLCRAKGIRTAIASSSVRELIRHNLARSDLTEYIDEIVSGQDVALGKPAPDIFLLACEKLKLAPPSCLVFEDALTGIEAAHRAGCYPVMIPDQVKPTDEIRALCVCRPSLLAAQELLDI